MTSRKRGTYGIAVLLLLPLLLLVLASCGGASTGSNGNSGSQKVQLRLGSKKDLEARLISKMYALLLTKAGFDVKESNPGTTPIVFGGIKNGDIDLYPEFTSTGLDALQQKPTNDPQKDYQTVKDGFNTQFKITWLDVAPLNDTYAFCMTKARAQELGVTKISDLKPKLSQLTMALPSDSLYVLDFVSKPYGITQKSFKGLQKVDYSIGFETIANKQADVAFCYSTDVTIQQRDLLVLEDDQKAFPPYNPAPIVRNSVLEANPKIKDALNPLAPILTNEVSLTLQKQTLDKQNAGASANQAIKAAAEEFLKSKGLL